MPIVIDPAFTPPPPPESVTSSDGVLTAVADNTNGGALLVADFSSLSPTPRRVRFERTDGSRVRSGDDALAPGGIAVAYDAESPLGGAASWVAIPVFADGSEGDASAAAAVALTAPAPSTAWLKVVSEPTLSMRVEVATVVESGRTLRNTLTPIVGSPYPTSVGDVPMGWSGRLEFSTDTEDDYYAIVAALSSGPVLLQAPTCMGIPGDMYLVPVGSLTAERLAPTGYGWQYLSWTVDFVEVDRPATVDAPLLLPSLSWEDVAQDYASWDALAGSVPSWVALLGGTV